MLEYLHSFEGAWQSPFKPVVLQQFSAPDSTTGYNDRSISDEIITEVYLEFGQKTRQEESSEYLKTVTGKQFLLSRLHFHKFLPPCSHTVQQPYVLLWTTPSDQQAKQVWPTAKVTV